LIALKKTKREVNRSPASRKKGLKKKRSRKYPRENPPKLGKTEKKIPEDANIKRVLKVNAAKKKTFQGHHEKKKGKTLQKR